jgi:hypothetical protein
MMIGRLTATVIGPGFRRMDGPGLVTNRGAGRRITTVAGSITTTVGPGVREVVTTEIEVGGVRRSSHFTFHSITITAGIRFITTNAIHTHVITIMPLVNG